MISTAAGAADAQAPAPAAPAQAPTAASAAPSAQAASAKHAARIGITSRRLNVRAGRTARVGGRLQPAGRRTVTLERLGGKGWRTIDKDRTSSTGRFELKYKTSDADSARVRVRFAGDRATKPEVRRIGRLKVFRPAVASWYGPGLYGGHLACGGTLTPGTVGVAHKTLPCGTKLYLRNGSKIIRARVVDRGPYVGGREFDLTAATKQKLGFGSTGTVGVAH